ncbi:hypothetical protein KY285_010546 [Solanum tuberosum]|nr:hypothetical protein KY289_011095 [Solanum tuberosum]KAH0734839.1 hypothetical protein KY285_010546 [Solanum tuberosum]
MRMKNESCTLCHVRGVGSGREKVTTRRGKHTIDLPVPSEVERVVEKVADEIEVTRESKDAIEKEVELIQKFVPMPRPPPPFPQRLMKKTEKGKYRRGLSVLRMMRGWNIVVLLLRGHLFRRMRILELSLFLVPLLDLGAPKLTAMHLAMSDRTMKRPNGVFQDFLVKVESFIFPADFMILDCKVDFEVPFILGILFLATGRALVDMERGQMKFLTK